MYQENKKCSIIVSTKSFIKGHKDRLLFAADIKKFNDKIDFFGFGFNPIKNKRDAIDPYFFSIAIENIYS